MIASGESLLPISELVLNVLSDMPADAARAVPPAITGLGWAEYEQLLTKVGDRRFSHAYDSGELPIMTSPRKDHEIAGHILAGFVRDTAVQIRRGYQSLGATTLRSQALGVGAEPDAAFYLTNEEVVRSRPVFDATIDPPPDLLIEIEITKSAEYKMPIYSRLLIPEVWRFNGRQLRMLHLVGDNYVESPHCRAIPYLRKDHLEQLLNRVPTAGEMRIVLEFAEWLEMTVPIPG